MSGAQAVGPADSLERLEVTVLLRRADQAALDTKIGQLTGRLTGGPGAARLLTRSQFAKRHGAKTADIAAVRAFAARHGLAIVSERPECRSMVLSGTVAEFNRAFKVKLLHMQHAGGSYRGRTGAIHLPAALNGVVEAVLGLDDRPQATAHCRLRAAAPVSYTPTQLAAAYGFPAGTGQGQCVGIIELGGGFRSADLQVYFKALGVGSPNVTAVSVDHGKNLPTGNANGPDGEVMLDIEVVGAIAPKAQIVVYFAPNTDAGFLDAISTAVHDTTHKPSVISISWGGPESSWTGQAMNAMDQAFQAAATMGITVCVASGDNGSSDGVADGANHVDFPASSPHVLACGGTSLPTSANLTDEQVWNAGAGGASGGGVSDIFAVPRWQAGLKTTTAQGRAAPLSMRGVPDVAGDADPGTGYQVRIDGTDTVIGGTSAVAPLWAGLIARINQAKGLKGSPVGFVNRRLYSNAQGLRDITQGNNGAFSAAPGWDACTGLGTPNGKVLAGIL
jgi:kumamolisin